MEQFSIFADQLSMAGCGDCLCRDCLRWWSSRCPHGECYDDLRAKKNPYNEAHPDRPPRTGWSNWRSDQAYWCRGGATYPAHACADYVHYEGSKIEECLCANVQKFQDGYISCSLVDSLGCEACYERFMNKMGDMTG